MLYYEDVARQMTQCGQPGCTATHADGPMYIHSACHPEQPLHHVSYFNGAVQIECGVCKKLVSRVAIARLARCRR